MQTQRHIPTTSIHPAPRVQSEAPTALPQDQKSRRPINRPRSPSSLSEEALRYQVICKGVYEKGEWTQQDQNLRAQVGANVPTNIDPLQTEICAIPKALLIV